MKIIWTQHAAERQQEWQIKLGITREEIEDALRNPSQVVPGDWGAQVAQCKHGDGLLRVPFVQVEDARKVLTVYWTSKVDKYWREE